MLPLPLNKGYIDGLNNEWRHLASPGTWWTGAERVAIAAVARAAREHQRQPPVELPTPAIEAAKRLSAEPHIDADWVNQLTAGGLMVEAYVELLGIVARLNAVDSFMFGIATDAPQPLPNPIAGDPSHRRVDAAAPNGGLVPTVGKASAPNALSAVQAETDAMLDLHGVLYLSIEEMGDLEITKSLTRAQMEFVAARTSLLNDCFF